MAQFNGKIPPPWQARQQTTQLQNSLLGQLPVTAGPISNQQIVIAAAPQPPQYASVQQSIIQPPGLGGLQAIPQAHIAQHNISQPPATLVQGQASITPVSLPQQTLPACQVSSSLIAPSSVAPNIPTGNIVTHPQLVQSQMQQIPSQVTNVAYPAQRALVPPVSFNSQIPPVNHAAGIVSNVPPGSGIVAAVPPTASVVGSSNSGQQPQKQRVFTGSVTKLCADFGFVDEDVFFQTSCVKGASAKVGDRVLVEASYNPNMPFKWNANRVQVIPAPINAPSGAANRSTNLRDNSRSMNFSVVPPSSFNSDSSNSTTFGNRLSIVTRPRSPRRDRRDESKRIRPDREEKEKDAKRENRKRSRSRDRSRSPVRRRPRVVPRYNVQVPKIMLHMKEANVLELRKRYSNLYVPSDVFLAKPLWSETFPAHRSFQFPRSVSFHIMSKEVDSIQENEAIYDAPDVNHSYAAKVMLMAIPPLEDIYRRSCALSEDLSDLKSCFVHPTRLINFLVGLKGKNETMAIGGYWSPSLDGPNPDKDPNVLIKTAVRTCKALTGIDLSRCTTWYRFAEIYYRRGECTHKGRLIPARVETTVLFLPDVWNICPTKLEWEDLQISYRKQLDHRLQQTSTSSNISSSTSTEIEISQDSKVQEKENSENDVEEKEPVKNDPTHWASLDPKTMKVLELRNELDARMMNSKGLKSQLIARLTKTLKAEQEKEEEQEKLLKEKSLCNEDTRRRDEDERRKEEEKRKREEDKRREEEEKKKTEEREKTLMEKRYTLPDQPMILVHPSRSAKSKKFDCTTMSLSVLLDYRQEDNKEHSFEVSLFAELFNEMLMRDFAFKIFTALVEAPDKSKDEKKEKEKKGDEERDEKKEERYDKKDDKEDKTTTDKKNDVKEEKEKENQEEEEEMEEDDYEDIEEDDTKEAGMSDCNKPSTEKDKEKDSNKSSDNNKDKRKEETKKDVRDSSGGGGSNRREKKEKKKMVTINPLLLLSFVYFDQTHTGYILDKDLEDIVNILGLNFSRAQLKKLMSKVISRDAFYYRKFTDIPVDDKPKYKENLSILDYEQLAKGNNDILPLFGDTLSSSEKISKKSSQSTTKDEPIVTSSGVVKYEGSLVDIGKLMQQLERSEKARCDTEEKLKDLQRELASSKDDSKKSLEKNQRLSRELKSLQTSCKSTDEELKKALEDNSIYIRALHQVNSVIRPLVSGDDTEEIDNLTKSEDSKIKIEISKNGYPGL